MGGFFFSAIGFLPSLFGDDGIRLAASRARSVQALHPAGRRSRYWSGGMLGWLASIVMQPNAEQGMLLNIIVGIVGAFLGGLLLAPLLGTGTINQSDFSIGSLFVSFLGAVILLAIVNFFRRRRGVRT